MDANEKHTTICGADISQLAKTKTVVTNNIFAFISVHLLSSVDKFLLTL
jgi:hypothetical protein